MADTPDHAAAPPPPAPDDRALTDDDLRRMRQMGFYRWAEGYEALRADVDQCVAHVKLAGQAWSQERARAEAAEAELRHWELGIKTNPKLEAENKRLREALEAMLTSTEEDFDGDWELIVQEARAALEGGNDG